MSDSGCTRRSGYMGQLELSAKKGLAPRFGLAPGFFGASCLDVRP